MDSMSSMSTALPPFPQPKLMIFVLLQIQTSSRRTAQEKACFLEFRPNSRDLNLAHAPKMKSDQQRMPKLQ
jgi:hypothetical protein